MRAASPPCMRDWLALHGMTAQGCARLLATEPPLPEPVAHSDTAAEWPDGPALWALVARALTHRLPELTPEIEQTAGATVLNFAPDRARHPKPFALYITEKSLVYVSCPLSRSAADLAIAAHEFGHALQLHCIAGAALAPVLRETCAFLAEEMVPPGLADLSVGHAGAAADALAGHRARNLGAMRQRLQACLARPGAAYDYSWNYPPARILALLLLQEGTGAVRRAVFHGEKSLADLRRDLHA
ncbi:hypothetical protein PVW47_01210 [Marinovum sp. SP66]|nr:hypothetical protein [Marinovum sp. SP66]MDD9738392.1 hypothetical protein [Marinovum sp. SP66]